MNDKTKKPKEQPGDRGIDDPKGIQAFVSKRKSKKKTIDVIEAHKDDNVESASSMSSKSSSSSK